MATSTDYLRIAGNEARLIPETAFDAFREAVVVVDLRRKCLPIVLANATARRCLVGDCTPDSMDDFSLYALLDKAADIVVSTAMGLRAEVPSASWVLNWGLLGGNQSILTEIKSLHSGIGQRLVMLTFAEPAAESTVFSAIEHRAPGLLILNTELTVTYANPSAVRTAGGLPGGILSYSGLALVPTAGIPREAFVLALAGEHYHDEAVAVTAPGAPTRWFEMDIQPLKNASGIAGLAVLSNEVTERRSGRLASTAGERRLLALTEHASDIITVAGRDGRLQYVSGGIWNSLGYTVDEWRSTSLLDHVHPEDVETIRAKYAQLVAGAIAGFSQQFRMLHKNGTYRWLESNYASALDNPLINGVVVNSRDITERRQAESRLAQREEVFRLAADAVNGIIFEWDLVREVVHRSRGVKEVLGLDAEVLAQEGEWSARIHPLDGVGYAKTISAAVRDGDGWTANYRIRDARGRYRSMLERGLIQRSEQGIAVRAIGCCVDVSEIKRLTDLLAEAQRAAKMGAWEFSVATQELTWTDEMFRIYEANPAELAVAWEPMLARFTPESRMRFDTAYAAAAEQQTGGFDLELEIDTLRGNRLWVRIIGQVEMIQGRPFRVFGSVQNIQAQKLAQIALENSTGWLKLSMNMAHMHPWRWDRATDSLDFAIVDGKMVHLPRVFPGMKNLMGRVHPKDRPAIRKGIDRAWDTRQQVQVAFRLKSRNGQYRSYEAIARPLFDAAGRPSGLVGVSQDVTARHEAEKRLRRSEELLRITTANTADTLVLLDTDLRIRFINRSVGGMTIEQIIGRHVAVLLPDAARDGFLSRLRLVLATARTAEFEFDIQEADGGLTQYFENRAVLVRDQGLGTCLSVTMRNATERKRLEKEILEVSSRERHTIGRDLHDGLGQELTGIALMLRALATRIYTRVPESRGQVDEIVGLVNQSIETARGLARGLLPLNPDGGGLTFALRALADRGRDVYGLTVDFRAEVAPQITFSEASSSHLYRIAQEALTNTARHGRASAASILLIVTRAKFLLQITDDGIGIGNLDPAACGMGLKIMKYRAGMIGARFEIVANQPHGTVVRVTGEQSMVMSALHCAHAI